MVIRHSTQSNESTGHILDMLTSSIHFPAQHHIPYLVPYRSYQPLLQNASFMDLSSSISSLQRYVRDFTSRRVQTGLSQSGTFLRAQGISEIVSGHCPFVLFGLCIFYFWFSGFPYLSQLTRSPVG